MTLALKLGGFGNLSQARLTALEALHCRIQHPGEPETAGVVPEVPLPRLVAEGHLASHVVVPMALLELSRLPVLLRLDHWFAQWFARAETL